MKRFDNGRLREHFQGTNQTGRSAGIRQQRTPLADIPPERFYRVAFALKAGLQAVDQYRPEEEGEAPGISGAYCMLQDEELWHAVTPLVEGLKVFAERLADRWISRLVIIMASQPVGLDESLHKTIRVNVTLLDG